mgnify:CR=1 FL=1
MAETVLETSGLTMRFGGVTASDNALPHRAEWRGKIHLL